MNFRNLLFGGSTLTSKPADAGRAFLRIFTGLALALGHGISKIPPSDSFVDGVAEMGFPIAMFFAWMAALTEFAGGLLLAVGISTRPVALLITINMAVAAFIRHAGDPFGGKERALLFLAIALFFLLAGAGRYAVDSLLRSKNTNRL